MRCKVTKKKAYLQIFGYFFIFLQIRCFEIAKFSLHLVTIFDSLLSIYRQNSKKIKKMHKIVAYTKKMLYLCAEFRINVKNDVGFVIVLTNYLR